MDIKEKFYQKLQESREQLDEVSKELAKRAENKAAEKFYDKYDSTTDLRKKAIKSKKKEDIEAAKEEEGKMHKAGKQAAKFQKYAAKKKMNEEQLDEISNKLKLRYKSKAKEDLEKRQEKDSKTKDEGDMHAYMSANANRNRQKAYNRIRGLEKIK